MKNRERDFWIYDGVCKQCGEKGVKHKCYNPSNESESLCENCGAVELSLLKEDPIIRTMLQKRVIDYFNEGKFRCALQELGYDKEDIANADTDIVKEQVK
jgi:hypothetical protein